MINLRLWLKDGRHMMDMEFKSLMHLWVDTLYILTESDAVSH